MPHPITAVGKFTVLLDDLISLQIEFDERYGAVGVEEACSVAFEPDLTKASKLDEEGKAKIVAIASLINLLQDEAEKILNKGN